MSVFTIIKMSNGFYKKYLEISRRINNVKYIEFALNALSQGYNAIGDYQNAIQYAEECLKSVRKSGDGLIEAYALKELATAYKGLGELSKAVTLLRRSFNLSREIHGKDEPVENLLADWVVELEKERGI